MMFPYRRICKVLLVWKACARRLKAATNSLQLSVNHRVLTKPLRISHPLSPYHHITNINHNNYTFIPGIIVTVITVIIQPLCTVLTPLWIT